jgi:translation initiation factor 3 subunit B
MIFKSTLQVSIFLGSVPDPVEKETRPRWTETYIKWSPLGSYLATFHSKGIAIWGGDDFHRIAKFSHPGVQVLF